MNGFKGIFSVALTAACASAFACTSWVITAGSAVNGKIIIHKSRDSYYGSPLNAELLNWRRGRRFIRIGSDHNYCFAVGSNGIAYFMNDGDRVFKKYSNADGRNGAGSHDVARYAVTDADSASDVVRKIAELTEAGTFAGLGSFLAFTDGRELYVTETNYEHNAVSRITKPFHIFGNSWHVPGAENVSTNNLKHKLMFLNREMAVRNTLRANRENGKYGPLACFAASRITDKTVGTGFGVFKKLNKINDGRVVSSLSACTFEVDTEYPDVLTTVYMALGPQQHTIYLPITMAISEMPEIIRNGEWSKYAYHLRKVLGDDHAELKGMIDFETRQYREFIIVRGKAKELLKQGKRSEAIKILQECFDRQFQATGDYLRNLVAKHPVSGK